MIQHDSNIVEQADIEGRTVLMWAAGKGANGVIRILLGLNDSEKENKDSSNPGKPILNTQQKKEFFM